VEVSLLGRRNKVVTNTQRFEFIQTERCRTKCCRARWCILRDGDQPISDEQT
jgi:hypothetical protein